MPAALALLFASALAAELPLFQVDLKAPLPPLVTCVSPAVIEQGLLRTSTQAGWRRSGLLVGPLPVPRGALTIETEFRPLALGPQSQELASETPSTHWYMLFADSAGRLHLHTRANGQWQQRHVSTQAIATGTWYRTRLTLSATSLAGQVTERDSGAVVFEFPATPVDALGEETTFYLCDEGPTAASGRTEWAGLKLGTDDPELKRRIDAKTAEVAREQRERDELNQASRLLRAAGVALLPFPRRVSVGAALFRLKNSAGLSAPPALREAAATVREVLRERCGIELPENRPGVTLHTLGKDDLPGDQTGQGYRLVVAAEGVRLAARTPAGFFYGAQTLAQLVRADGRVPAVQIDDYPAIPQRLVMVAIDQGGFQCIDVDYWKRMIRELAAVKINRIMPYFEGAGMRFRKYPFLGLKGAEGFTPDKARELSDYAWQHQIQMIPQQQSVGHSGVYFAHKQLQPLCEEGGTFCSSRPEVFAFLADLYDELVEAFPHAEYIHVGGDEFAHNFAKCPQCKARAEQIGKPGLYAEHLGKLQALLAARQRKMMIWWHEEGYTEAAADKLSKDISIFDWHYGNQASYPTLDRLQKLGFGQTWATPAVTRYYDPGNDFTNTFGNISGFLRAGARAKVPGECTCTWVHGIWGGRNLFELNYYALLYSGQCAWNPAGDDPADFRWRYGRHWFGLSGDDLDEQVLQAVHAPYGTAAEQRFWANNRAAQDILAAAPQKTFEELAKQPHLATEAATLLALCDRADAVLKRWQTTATRHQVTVDFLRHDVHIQATAARRLRVLAQVRAAADRATAAPAGERAALLAESRQAVTALIADYDRIEAMFERSVREAGGGRAGAGGWYPFIAGGGIEFRVQAGRDGLKVLADKLGKLAEGTVR